MIRHKLLYFVVAGFVTGVFVYSLFQGSWPFGLEFSFLFVFLSAVLFIWLLFRDKLNSYLGLIAVFILCFALGIMRFGFAIADDGDPVLDKFIGESVIIEGVIIEQPDRRETSTRLIVEAKNLFFADVEEETHSKILVVTDPYWEYSYGDKVSISGKLTLPENFESETGRTFGYISYLGKDDIFYQISFADIAVLSRGHGNKLKEVLFGTKEVLLGNINKSIPSPESGLLAGEIFGERGGLSKDWQEAFRKTGLIHVVVLSGYNVTIVADAIVKILLFLPRYLGFSFGALGIIFFAILTGAGPTIVRASIMAILVLIARGFGREYYVFRALILAGGIMILHNPKILLFDISFQLSFLATLGLIFVSPMIENKLGFVPEKLQMRSNAIATISAQIMVLPLLVYYMGEVSVLAIPVNMLVLFVIPATMLLGFITSILGLLPFSLGPLSSPAYAFLHYQMKIVEFFSKIPHSTFIIPEFGSGVLILIYILIVFALIFYRTKKNK